MKKWLLVATVATFSGLASCGPRVVPTRPPDVVYSRTHSPGPQYVWVSGDWIWSGGKYHWREGYWAKRRSGRTWHEGYWESRHNGYRWHKGHW